MKNSCLLFILLCFPCFLVSSQAQVMPEDSIRVMALLDKGYGYEVSYPDSAHLVYRQAFEISDSIGFWHGAAKALSYRGIVYSDQGDYGKAIEFYDKSNVFFEKIASEVSIATNLINKGNVYQFLSDYSTASEYYLQGISVFESLADTARLGIAYENLGGIFARSFEWEKARYYNEKALAYAIATNDTLNIGFKRANIALIDLEYKDYDKAFEGFSESMEIAKKYDNDLLLYHGYLNFYNYYQKQNQLAQAIDFAKKSLEQSKKLNNPFLQSMSLSQLGYIYNEDGQASKALPLLLEALTMAEENGFKKHLVETHEHLYKVYMEQNRYELALEAYQASTLYNDSILNEEKSKYVLLLEQQYQSEKKEKEIALLAKEKEVQQVETKRQATLKKASMGGLAFVIMLAALVVYTFWQRLKNQKLLATKDAELTKENFQKQVAQLEMKALRAQINPHFIFNSMNSINSMILVDDTDNASRYLTKFSKLVRLILENSENSTVSLKDELEMLETYIQLEAKRFEGKINYEFSIDPEIDQETTKLPSMVLQPFIENAIWHGLRPKQEEGVLKIILKEQGDQLKCVIEDNGIGREKALLLKEKKLHKHKSMGLKLTEERLKLLNKSELKKLINFTDLKDKMDRALGTRVEVIIPVS